MGDLKIRNLDPAEYQKWDALVKQSAQGTVFHRSYWLKASGTEFAIYGYFKGDELLAGLPMVCVMSRLGLKYASHPPLTPYLGIIFKQTDAKYVTRISVEKQISKAIAARIKEDFDFIHFNFTPFSTDLQPFIWEGFSSDVRYTYVLELHNLENVWNAMDARRRNDIVRAGKDGIYVEVSSDFEQTFALVEKTFERQNKQATFRSTAFKYNEVLRQRGQCNSFQARDMEGKAIASVYIVWDENTSYYILGGYDAEKSHHGASAIAMWEAIKFTKQELGLNQFDFEGSMIPPVEQFFRKFGANLTPYYSVTWMKPSVEFASYTTRLVKAGLRILRLR